MLRKENKQKGITLPNFKIYYKVLAITQYGTGNKKRHRDQRNRRVSPEINECTYNPFSRKIPRTQNGKRIISLINGARKTGLSTCKRMKTDLLLTLY
jgi:hypothetical protein